MTLSGIRGWSQIGKWNHQSTVQMWTRALHTGPLCATPLTVSVLATSPWTSQNQISTGDTPS
jgi:hypothetical protein